MKQILSFTMFIVLLGGVPICSRAQMANEVFLLPQGRVGEEYQVDIEALLRDKYRLRIDTSRRDSILQWSFLEGELPVGLTLRTNGNIAGKPESYREKSYLFRVRVADHAVSSAEYLVITLSLAVTPPRLRLTRIEEPRLVPIDNAATEAQSPRTPPPLSLSPSTVRVEPNPPRDGDESEPQRDDESPCSVGVESNSDVISIAVRNDFTDSDIRQSINMSQDGNLIGNQNELIARTLGTCNQNNWQQDDYVILHLVKWPEGQPAGGDLKYEPKSEKWYLYRRVGDGWERQTVQGGERIYGHKRVGVLLVHLIARETWDIKYTVEVKDKVPGPIQNILDLAGIIAAGAAGLRDADIDNKSYWGGRILMLQKVPVDLVVKSEIAFVTGGETTASQQSKVYSKTFDNEGRYHWDVSVGLPVKSFKEIEFDADAGQVRAKEVNRVNAYGFLNLFLNPRGVDTKGEEFYKTPHLVLGVPISGKPLDRPMVGMGIGSYNTALKFNLFAGVVFNRIREPRTLAAGETATPAELESDLQTRRVTKFIFGFNIPVKQFKEALTSKK